MMLELKHGPKLLEPAPSSNDDELGRMVDGVRLFALRRYKMVVLLGIVGLFVGLAYLKFERPSYTATAVISVANREGRYLQEQATVAEWVTRKLRLDNDPEFGSATGGLLQSLRKLWSGNPIDPGSLQLRTAVS